MGLSAREKGRGPPPTPEARDCYAGDVSGKKRAGDMKLRGGGEDC